jgi:cell division septum initiation protein DivIVA
MNMDELKNENLMLRDLLQNRVPVGCVAETTYQPILDENEKLKEENEKLKDKLWDVEETIRVAIASRLAHWFPDEKMGDNEYAEDCDIANNLNGDDLVKMIDGFRDDILQTHKKENEKLKALAALGAEGILKFHGVEKG